MIAVVSQPMNSENLVTSQQFAAVMAEMKNIAEIQADCLFNYENLQMEVEKVAEKSVSAGVSN